jgi:hypothetical protein
LEKGGIAVPNSSNVEQLDEPLLATSQQRRLVLARFAAIALTCAAWLSATAASAQSRWPHELVAGPFHCHATFGLAPYHALFDELAQLERDLNDTLGVVKVREPIHVYLFSTQGVYQQYISQYFPDVPYRRALFVKKHGPGMVFAYMNPDFAIDLRHE